MRDIAFGALFILILATTIAFVTGHLWEPIAFGVFAAAALIYARFPA